MRGAACVEELEQEEEMRSWGPEEHPQCRSRAPQAGRKELSHLRADETKSQSCVSCTNSGGVCWWSWPGPGPLPPKEAGVGVLLPAGPWG